MSIPLSYCLISKAARGDEEAYQQVKEAMIVNLRYGHWSQFPCPHDPPCPEVSQEQADAFHERMKNDLKDVPRGDWGGPPGASGVSGFSSANRQSSGSAG